MHIIIGMPLHIIIIGMPMFIMEFMASQHSFIIAMSAPSIGIILQTMPSLPISQVMRQFIIGRIIMGIGIIMPIIPFIIGIPIIGFMPIMFPIMFMGIGMPFIICMGIPPPIIGIGIPPFIIGIGIEPFIIIGIGWFIAAFIMGSLLARGRAVVKGAGVIARALRTRTDPGPFPPILRTA